jgi:hypothetical protein
MALSRGKLSNVTQVAAGNTSAIVTVADNKKVYIKSIVIHDASEVGVACTSHVYYVPNGGNVDDTTRIFNVVMSAKETILIEPSYPIVLESTGDSLRVGAKFGSLNVLVNGDKEV